MTALLGGCALPDSGPSASEVANGAAGTGADGAAIQNYELVDVDANVVAILKSRVPDSFYARFGDYRPPVEPVIGLGDLVRVTIWESGAGGLFSADGGVDHISTGSKSATIPDQPVGRDGNITVPYAGNIRVLGSTPHQVQARIVHALTGQAIQPQVLVTISRQVSSDATVIGEGTAGAVVPLAAGGSRILDAIAQAGGVHTPVYETEVRIARGGRTVSETLSTIMAQPREDIYLRPGDVVTLVHHPRTFIAIGATGANAQIAFDSDRMTLADALGKAGGLQDYRADPAGVFVFRYEDAEIARRIRPASALSNGAERVAFVYRLNMRDPGTLLVAQGFPMFEHDILYASNSPYVAAQKVAQIFGSVSQPVTMGASIRSAVR